ncbi:hypothetical protein V8G54_028491 [Vigna mungo]|uniref:Uncharacterized protein n=1 Tax=Vigna mungo TaxID=3915 RepID=A0AAQ3RLQ3_VIGMU
MNSRTTTFPSPDSALRQLLKISTHFSSDQLCNTAFSVMASPSGTLANISPPTCSTPDSTGAFSMTWGRSKLIPLIEGYLETIIFRFCPFPPPTSTNLDIPSNPVYMSSILFISVTHKSAIDLLKISFIFGLFSMYWYVVTP